LKDDDQVSTLLKAHIVNQEVKKLSARRRVKQQQPNIFPAATSGDPMDIDDEDD
jgi:hypothetical protein